MPARYTAYIDEAGDEGFSKLAAAATGGQSRWLVLGACIVSRENDLRLPAWRDAILARFPMRRSRDLHFRDLKHDQKVVACQELAKLPIGAATTLSHKVTIPGSHHERIFGREGYLYNYLLRWLLERVTQACAERSGPDSCKLKIVLSRRGGTNYESMRTYLELIRDGREVVETPGRIDWDVLDLDLMAVENHTKWAGLQIADCITSAFFKAVEPNGYGNCEPAYALLLKQKLLKRRGAALGRGVTPVPSMEKAAPDEAQRAFFDTFR